VIFWPAKKFGESTLHALMQKTVKGTSSTVARKLPKVPPGLLEAQAWIGDDDLSSNLRFTCVKRTGVRNDNWVQEHSTNAFMQHYLLEIGYREDIDKKKLSVHQCGTFFEYLYATDTGFRREFNDKHLILERHEAKDLTPDHTEYPIGKCWQILFKGKIKGDSKIKNMPFLMGEQIRKLAEVNTWSDGKFDIVKGSFLDHIVPGTSLSAESLVASMSPKRSYGGSDAEFLNFFHTRGGMNTVFETIRFGKGPIDTGDGKIYRSNCKHNARLKSKTQKCVLCGASAKDDEPEKAPDSKPITIVPPSILEPGKKEEKDDKHEYVSTHVAGISITDSCLKESVTEVETSLVGHREDNPSDKQEKITVPVAGSSKIFTSENIKEQEITLDTSPPILTILEADCEEFFEEPYDPVILDDVFNDKVTLPIEEDNLIYKCIFGFFSRLKKKKRRRSEDLLDDSGYKTSHMVKNLPLEVNGAIRRRELKRRRDHAESMPID